MSNPKERAPKTKGNIYFKEIDVCRKGKKRVEKADIHRALPLYKEKNSSRSCLSKKSDSLRSLSQNTQGLEARVSWAEPSY